MDLLIRFSARHTTGFGVRRSVERNQNATGTTGAKTIKNEAAFPGAASALFQKPEG